LVENDPAKLCQFFDRADLAEFDQILVRGDLTEFNQIWIKVELEKSRPISKQDWLNTILVTTD